VDAGAPKGSFILAGSVSKNDTSLHSGAGRILSLRMRPFALSERFANDGATGISIAQMLATAKPFSLPMAGATTISFNDYVDEITRSGFPGIRHSNAEYAAKLLASYLHYAVTRDFAAQGVSIRRPATLTRWLKAFAASVATDAGYGEILDASTPGEGDKPARGTTNAYRDALERLWLIDELPAWVEGGNWLSRLRTSPRHHLADPALVCSLLGVTKNALLTGGAKSFFDGKYKTLAGRLFESLVVQTARVCADAAGATVHYLRTQNGLHEVDIIIQKERRVLAFEVKLSPTVADGDARHLRWLREQLGDTLMDAAVITTGATCYRRKADGIAVIPAAMLAP
jgi:predicted AAA+ superfamily ATPase